MVRSGSMLLQFGEGARLHLCMNEWNCSTLVRRRLSLTQAVQDNLNPTVLALVMGMKANSQNVHCTTTTTTSLFLFLQQKNF